ncbi:MAG TPA: pyridoxamine 5'-phosphate oxidase family protein [Sphingomicrobium sp.]|jgi:nitroimidazol reductase NimA-like FMN-containing flavoprotein (pyridoxamine 5'-phosphate oxidase superfamily)|nr:pyridoxamine 5'-phosphate oxidase family protein [Sphingomicrobium sp.]
MKDKAIDILGSNRLMAIATLRPDGWPQATMVSYANEDILIYFIISRESQKFANIERDDRVSIVIGEDVQDPSMIRSVSIAARASEVRDPKQKERAVKLLLERHPGLSRLERPEPGHSAVMRANPEIITILDYSKGFGHADLLTVGPGGLTQMTAARDDDWGFGRALKPLT